MERVPNDYYNNPIPINDRLKGFYLDLQKVIGRENDYPHLLEHFDALGGGGVFTIVKKLVKSPNNLWQRIFGGEYMGTMRVEYAYDLGAEAIQVEDVSVKKNLKSAVQELNRKYNLRFRVVSKAECKEMGFVFACPYSWVPDAM